MTDELDKSADRLIELANRQAARIELLEAALRTIRLQNVEPYCREIARAVLFDKDESQ